MAGNSRIRIIMEEIEKHICPVVDSQWLIMININSFSDNMWNNENILEFQTF